MKLDKITVYPIDKIKVDPNNIATHPQHDIERMANGLIEFGLRPPILVKVDPDNNGHVIAADGNLRLLSIQHNHQSPEPIYDNNNEIIDFSSIPTIHCDDWSPEQIIAYQAFSRNSAGWVGFNDNLDEALQSLQNADYDMDMLGFDEMSSFDSDGNYDGNNESVDDAKPPEDFKEFDEDTETQYCCPKCSYEWSGKPK